MVIDMNVLPAFIEELNPSEDQINYCRKVTGLYKMGAESLESIKTLASASGIDKICLMPLDLSTSSGGFLGTNEEVASLVRKEPDFIIGFASVDPNRSDALDIATYALKELNLSGLMLNPALQRFTASDKKYYPIYQLCQELGKPISFHAGMSACPGVMSSEANPLFFEEIACSFPNLRMNLQHFGWPWTREVAMLLLKYKNIYTDLSCLYFDNANEFYSHIFSQDLGEHWIDRSLRHQLMFASEDPRLEMRRMIAAVRGQNWRESTVDMVLGGNATEFLMGGRIYD